MQTTWVAMLTNEASGSGTALASSAALTDVSPAPQIVVPANTFLAGQQWRVRAGGVFSNTGTPTLLLGVYIGGIAGTALAATGAITTITGATNWSWDLELMFRVGVLNGTTTPFMPWSGKVRMPASLTQFQAEYALPATAPATVNIDTTAAKAVTIGAQWGASSASNTLTCNGMSLELMN